MKSFGILVDMLYSVLKPLFVDPVILREPLSSPVGVSIDIERGYSLPVDFVFIRYTRHREVFLIVLANSGAAPSICLGFDCRRHLDISKVDTNA